MARKNLGRVGKSEDEIYNLYLNMQEYLKVQHEISVNKFCIKKSVDLHSFKNFYYAMHTMTKREDFNDLKKLAIKWLGSKQKTYIFCQENNINKNQIMNMSKYLNYSKIINKMLGKDNMSQDTKEEIKFIAVERNDPIPEIPILQNHIVPIDEGKNLSSDVNTIDITIKNMKISFQDNLHSEKIIKIIQFLKDL